MLTNKTEPHWREKIELRSYNPTYKGHPKQIQRAAEMLAEAKRPVILVGGGVIGSNAAAEVLELAQTARAPVTCTLMGLGGFPGTHELSLGMLGMHGTYAANMAISHADLILALGARFDDRVTGKVDEFAPGAKIIQADIDPTSISKNVKAHLPIVGDVKSVLHDLLPHLRPGKIDWQAKHQPWLSQVQHVGRRSSPSPTRSDAKMIKPQYVVEKIWELTRGEAIICTEVGQNQMWTAQFYKFAHPRSFITSGGLGTMGYGLPAAIGAQVAFPDRLVVDIAGDGSIQMNIQEMMTAVQYRLPGQGGHPEQPVPRHGPAVAGAVLRQALLLDLPELRARLREARRGLRRDGAARDQAGGGRADAREGVRDPGAGHGRRARLPRGERLPDGPRGGLPQEDDPDLTATAR